MRVLPCGPDAVLVEVDSLDEVLGFDAAARAADIAGITETVPAARTVLVRFDPHATGADFLRARLTRLRWAPRAPEDGPLVEIPVRYDGSDLDEVAQALGIDVAEVIERHTAAAWRVGFVGFAPGFAYLVGGGDGLRVPRRTSPRVQVPAGSVALADEYCGIYPRASPGGWQLLGTTDASLWDPSRAEPALLVPGTRVRFVAVGR
ncbi:MAG: allophanate hydrolase subunit 1 [Tetrasphaera sp.]